jgi:arylsulfatase A-like enzyme
MVRTAPPIRLAAAALTLALTQTLTACGDAPTAPPEPAPARLEDCTAPAPAELPDVLLVTFDTLRADHCGSYGYARPTTPTLDEVGDEGVLFETVYAVTPTTGPSHATLFTSLYPDEHHVLSNRWKLQGELVTLAEVLGAAGYRTGGFVSSYMVKADAGMAQGFDAFDDRFASGESSAVRREAVQGEEVRGQFDRRAADTADRALEWLAGEPADRPLFLWLHSYQPHNPYRPPPEAMRAVLGAELGPMWRPGRPGGTEEDRVRWRIARYDAETRYADDQVGRVLAALRARARDPGLLAVITSDHGEGLEDHGWPGHGIHLYEEAVRVPLTLSWPGRLPAGARVAAPVGLIDVMPTVLELLGVDCPDLELRGASLVGAWGETGPEGTRPVFLQRRAYARNETKFEGKPVVVKGAKLAVRDGPWKLVLAPEEGGPQLYDLSRDPAERENLAEQRPEVARRLEEVLRRWKADQRPRVPPPPALEEEDREGLEELGYVD